MRGSSDWKVSDDARCDRRVNLRAGVKVWVVNSDKDRVYRAYPCRLRRAPKTDEHPHFFVVGMVRPGELFASFTTLAGDEVTKGLHGHFRMPVYKVREAAIRCAIRLNSPLHVGASNRAMYYHDEASRYQLAIAALKQQMKGQEHE